jgi:hypothetical protein
VTFEVPQDAPIGFDAGSGFCAIVLGVTIALTSFPLTGCRAPVANRESNGAKSQSSAGGPSSPVASPESQAASREPRVPRHDLSVDEAMGGHTLARHIGKTDEELIERLQREPDISSASTYTDRPTAERVIGAALATDGSAFEKWRARQGRRPNFVLHYDAHEEIGRSVRRGRTRSQPCERALVVLRWDDRRRQFYVLTSYPEDNR